MTATWYDLFDAVFVLNLRRSQERLEAFYRNVPDPWPFRKPTVYTAIDGQKVPHPPNYQANLPSGSWGCFRSHYRILEDALNNDLNSILVFEDDVIFASDFQVRVDRFLRALPADWEWIYLGGKHIERNIGLPVPINREVYRAFNVHGCFAYGFRGRTAIERVYTHINSPERWRSRHCIDHRFGEMHRSYPGGVYVPAHWLVGHRAGPSTIRNRVAKDEFFRDADWLCNAPIDRRLHVVTGRDSVSAQLVAEALHHLGISFGEKAIDLNAAHGDRFAARVSPGLHELMRHLWDVDRRKPLTDESHRVCMLRQWASRRCHLEHNRGGRPLGAFHDAFFNLGDELCRAWDQPIAIVVHDEGFQNVPSASDDSTRRAAYLDEQTNRQLQDLPFETRIDVQANRFESSDEFCEWLCRELGLNPNPYQFGKAREVLAGYLRRNPGESH